MSIYQMIYATFWGYQGIVLVDGFCVYNVPRATPGIGWLITILGQDLRSHHPAARFSGPAVIGCSSCCPFHDPMHLLGLFQSPIMKATTGHSRLIASAIYID